ncbi:ABC transporter substrate-binding protein [Betaproteobacteria bacterium]|nr:ABC transporter substrate-binding protein [Betaproteobacteria bacterium]
MNFIFRRMLFAISLAVFIAAPAVAAPVTWKVVSNTRNSLQFKEKWQWFAEEMKKRTNGEVLVEVTSFPELNLNGQELIRMLNSNLLDVGEVVIGYVSGDAPILEGVQLVGMYRSYEHNHEGYKAFLPTVQEQFSNIIGGRPVGTFAFSAQHLWSRFPVNTLADLKGKKIRVFSVSQADYINALGGEAVFIPLADVYVSLERGLVDGCITGPESGAGQKMWEVTKYITDLRLGAGAGFVVISRKSYAALSEKNKAVFDQLAKEIDEIGWSIGVKDTKDGLDQAAAHGMTLTIPGKPEWQESLQEVARTVVIPSWAKRSGANSKDLFNKVFSPIVGFDVK